MVLGRPTPGIEIGNFFKKNEKEIMVIEELMLDFNLASFSICVFVQSCMCYLICSKPGDLNISLIAVLLIVKALKVLWQIVSFQDDLPFSGFYCSLSVDSVQLSHAL